MTEEIIEEEERKGFFTWLKEKFSKDEEEQEEEAPQYKRRLFDGRIEKYLDQNLDAYISEYGIVTGLDLEVYEERYDRLTKRITSMSEYMAEADVSVSVLEKDLSRIRESASRKK